MSWEADIAEQEDGEKDNEERQSSSGEDKNEGKKIGTEGDVEDKWMMRK